MFFNKVAGGSSIIPIADIVEYWNMNGNSNGYNGNDGFNDGLVTYPLSTLIDNAAQSSSTNRKINVSNISSVFSFGDGVTDSPFSISFWFKMDVVAQANLFSISETGAFNEYSVFYKSGTIEFQIYNQGLNDTKQKRKRRLSFTPLVGVWYHIACTYSGVQTEWGLVYVNAVLGTQQELSGSGYVAMQHTGQNVTMLTSETNSAFTLQGQMDEVAIFNKELSASEVTDLYNGGLAGTPIIG